MNKFDEEYINKFQCVGSVEISGIGHVDVKDEGSLLIAEYFIEYMRGKVNENIVNEREREKMKKENFVGSVDDYLQSDQGKKDTLTIMKKQEEFKQCDPDEAGKSSPDPKPKPDPDPGIVEPARVNRGRKPDGVLMTAKQKVLKYSEGKAHFKTESVVKRLKQFYSEAEIMKAISELIAERKLRQMPNDVIQVMTDAPD